jgi:isoleucyl-tRNA synthetase
MDTIRRLAALALAERAKAGIKVRQPLGRLTVKSKALGDGLRGILAEEINVKTIVFDSKLATDVVLDTAITPELAEEGFMRELVRNIQEMRRDGGFSPRDQIALHVTAASARLAVIERWKKFLEHEAGVRELAAGAKFKATVERDVENDGERMTLLIAKH